MAEKNISLERHDPDEVAKKADEPKKKAKSANDAPLPLLVEFTVMVCVIILVIVFLTIAGISLIKDATALDFVIRTGVSILTLGTLLTLLARQITFGMLAAETKKLPDQSQPAMPGQVEENAPQEVK